MRTQELWDSSAEAWIANMAQGDTSRTLLLDSVMLRLAGDVGGLKVCDVGCGEGRFCRMLAERGAETTGIEPTSRLLEEAWHRHPEGRYVEAGGEAIPVRSELFDLTVCYLVLIDIPDFRAAIDEMARITKAGGRILVANLNSFCTTSANAWVRDEENRGLYVSVDNYFGERPERVAWSGIDIINFHRPFEDYMQAFINAGLRLTHFEEPKPSLQQLEANPRLIDAARVPYFHVMQWRKD